MQELLKMIHLMKKVTFVKRVIRRNYICSVMCILPPLDTDLRLVACTETSDLILVQEHIS